MNKDQYLTRLADVLGVTKKSMMTAAAVVDQELKDAEEAKRNEVYDQGSEEVVEEEVVADDVPLEDEVVTEEDNSEATDEEEV
jgi:hypothetical protein